MLVLGASYIVMFTLRKFLDRYISGLCVFLMSMSLTFIFLKTICQIHLLLKEREGGKKEGREKKEKKKSKVRMSIQ